MGKFLSCVTFFGFAMIFTLPYVVICAGNGNVVPGIIIGHYIATVLVACAFISIGMLISSLTENQVIAAFASFGVVIALILLNNLAATTDNVTLSVVINWLSFYARYTPFSGGLFSVVSIVYYISITGIFLFLTTRVLEQKRWA